MINEYTAKRYCSEDISKIENYDKAIADITKTWHCHHSAEILPCGAYSTKTLMKFGLYWERPANELIFVTCQQHMRIHKIGNIFGRKGKPGTRLGAITSEQTKNKIRASKIGKPSPRKGVHLLESTKTKMSESKIGRHWYNDGEKSVCVRECPVGFKKGRL